MTDSNRDIAFSIQRSLIRLGYDAFVCFDGVQAINNNDTYDFDLCIINSNLPRLGANKVIELLKKKKDMPILLISTNTYIDIPLIYDNFGFNEIILLPFSFEQLKEKIEKMFVYFGKEDESIGDFVIFYTKGILEYKGNKINITNDESVLLKKLINKELIDLTDYKYMYPLVLALDKKLETLKTNMKISVDNDNNFKLEEV